MARRWYLFIALLIIVALIAGGVVLTRVQAIAAPEQPIAFNHQTHVKAGLQCLFCHSSALRSDIAGIPSLQRCMGCHTIIAMDNPAVQVLAGYWERSEPIPWNRVTKEPEFVYFSHQAHLRAGENCETCHGNVGQMTVTHPVATMDMGWCLDCHEKQEENKVARLTDCLTCHK